VPVALALSLAPLGLGSMPWGLRLLLCAALLTLALRSGQRLLAGRHPAAVASVSFEGWPHPPQATELRLRVRDGVERPAQLWRQSLLLPGAVLLVCRFEGQWSALGPGLRLPRRVYAPLLASECDPRAWRCLMWRLRRPPRTSRHR
jgi:hypothetical protein